MLQKKHQGTDMMKTTYTKNDPEKFYQKSDYLLSSRHLTFPCSQRNEGKDNTDTDMHHKKSKTTL
jgi:hypothetical protein